MGIDVKIRGLSTAETVAAAIAGGARYLGFVFFSPSPRSLLPAAAALLANGVPESVLRVGLLVDPDDAALDAVTAVVPLEIVQLHGGESPARVAEIRARTGLRVMKALPVEGREDLARIPEYEAVADLLLFDAPPPVDAGRPGGNARTFDWAILQDYCCRRPWFLAGGLDASNVAAAVRVSGAPAVDVSSGVEDRPGVKSVRKITRFLETVAAIPSNHPSSGPVAGSARPADAVSPQS